MTENDDTTKQITIWSQIQLENQKINPANKKNNESYINRNLQLGNLDKATFQVLQLRADKALLFADTQSEIYKRYAQRTLSRNEYTNILSGSKYGFVRTSINTTTQRQELKDESPTGLRGLFAGKNRK